jgi:hypothetical protein
MSWTDEVSPDHPEALANVEYDSLRRLVFDVLHGTAVIGPPPDPRRGIRPFEVLSDLFQRADRVVRSRVTEILREFLYELIDTAVWPAQARWDLLDLVQDCGHDGVVDDIRVLIRQKTLYQAADIGAAGHAGLVKCLLSLGALSTPEWWLEQFDLLGKDYGALIFSGLVEHGLDEAVSRLPMLCDSDHALQEMRLLIPSLVDEFGLERVREALSEQLASLSHTASKAFAEELRITVLPSREESRRRASGADFVADELALAGDRVTISDIDKLRETAAAVVQGLAVATDIIGAGSVESRNWLVLGQTAKLVVVLATLVSGEMAPTVLWRVCEKLVLAFAHLRLVSYQGVVEEFARMVLDSRFMTEDIQKFLGANSERLAESVRASEVQASSRRRSHH